MPSLSEYSPLSGTCSSSPTRCLVLVDKQGLTGKKAEYHPIPYRAITHFSVETAGIFDMNAEVKIYISGNPVPIQREFKRGTDIVGV